MSFWADPDPTRGTEQAKPRPFVIVSVDQLNRARLDLSLAAPRQTIQSVRSWRMSVGIRSGCDT